MARGPFPVLVAVGVEFCGVSQSLCHGRAFGLVLCRGRSIQIDKHILLGVTRNIRSRRFWGDGVGDVP